MILVGHLRLCQHQTLDEAHQTLLERLAPFALTISRREVLYLFDAYCTLLQIASAAREDSEWLTQVEANGGLIISIDGIQPDKGNETIYLVRDVLTGRVLTAENVSSSGKEVMKRVLAPVVADSGCLCWERSVMRKNHSSRPSPNSGPTFRINSASSMSCEKPRARSMNRTAN